MTRTAAEVKEIASGIVGKMVADVMYEFPKIKSAIDKADADAWRSFLDELTDAVEDILLNKFGSSG